jgi:hypothetical protein
MAWSRALMNQLVPMQLSNPSALRATLGVAAYIGCMHCFISVSVQLALEIKPKITLRASILLIGVVLSEV